MKKLVLIAAVLMTAVVTKAATVNWGAAICMPDASTAVATGSMAYLLYSASAFADTPVSFALNDSRVVDNHTITALEAGNYLFADSWSRTDVAGGVNGYYRMVMVIGGAGGTFAYYDTPQLTGISDVSSAGDVSYNMDWLPPTDFVGTNLGGTVVVPEPTSMALLAFGVAALGLRRRFKK